MRPSARAARRSALGAAAALALAACAGAPPPPADPAAAAEVERFFLGFRQKVQQGEADSVLRDLSRQTLAWLGEIRQAARTEPVKPLSERPFGEILAVLALRVERRLDPAFDDRPAGIMRKLVIESAPVRKSLLKTDLAPPRTRGDEAEVGLREAPSVPVFHFRRESGLWKLDLARSLPLILRGAESMARQRKPTPLEQAAWVLEQAGRPLLAEDLVR